MVRDVGLAEELAQDALVAALEQWPESGVPDNPGAWLMATAKHRAHRPLAAQQACSSASTRSSARELEAAQRTAVPDLDAAIDDDIGDDLLRLVFTACHPVLSTEARVALTLRLLGGLTTDEIARAFLVPEPTIAQRIVRAKRTLAEARVPFEVPDAGRAAGAAGLGAGGHLPHLQRGLLGDRRRRLDAAGALRGRAAAGPDPGRAGAGGAGGARPGRADGDPGLALARADRPVRRADPAARPEPRALGPAADPPRPGGAASAPSSSAARAGPYALQAAIAACHARARTAEETDWARIAALYDALAAGHAVAGGGAEPRGRGRRWRSARRPGLELVDALRTSRRSPATTCCRACAATCSPSSAATTRRGRSSSARPR